MTRYLIALDLDGTVLNHGALAQGGAHRTEIDADLRDAIQTLHRRGHEVVVATGRSVDATLPVVEALGITPKWVVSANGAMTLRRDSLGERGYRREYVEAFDPTEVLNQLRPQIGTARFAVERADGVFLYTEKIPSGTLPVKQKQVAFEELLGVQASRVIVVSPDQRLKEFIRAATSVGLNNVSYQVGNTTWLDIAPVGVTKSSALEMIRHQENISLSRVFAAGDGNNDIAMLKWAGKYGVSVAMGQAEADVRAAANTIAPTIDENGLLVALRERFAEELV